MNLLKHSLLAFFICSSLASSATLAADAKADIPVKREDAYYAEKYAENHANIKKMNRKVDLVFVGDSITDYWRDSPSWKKYCEPHKALNLGISGDKTENVLWRLQHGELDGYKAKLFVVMIGTNNENADLEVAKGIKAILEEISKKQPQAKILLLGIFPRSEKVDEEREKNVRVNKLIAKFDGGVIHYLDIGAKFLQADGTMSAEVMPDFLHPSEKGYEIWAKAIDASVKEMLIRRDISAPAGSGKNEQPVGR